MPQRGWKPADTTVDLSAAIGRKSPEARKRLLGKVGRRRHVSYVKKLIERKLPAGGKKEAVDKKYAAGDKRGKNCRGVGCRQHTIDEQGQVRLPPMVTKGGGERRRHSPPLDL